MSVASNPRLNEIRRREEDADARKVANFLLGLCALGFVAAILLMVK